MQVNKLCITIVLSLLKFLGANARVVPNFETFLCHQMTTASLQIMFLPSFSTSDHSCCVCLDDICELLATITNVRWCASAVCK